MGTDPESGADEWEATHQRLGDVSGRLFLLFTSLWIFLVYYSLIYCFQNVNNNNKYPSQPKLMLSNLTLAKPRPPVS